MSVFSRLLLWDGTHTAGVDAITHSLQVIDVPHHEIHEGESFHADRYDDTVANAASVSMILEAPAGFDLHMTWSAEIFSTSNTPTVCKSQLLILSGYTHGTALTEENRRIDFGAGNAIASYDGTLTTLGRTLEESMIQPGGRKVGGGSLAQSRPEWIVPAETAVVVRTFNSSGATAAVQIDMDWYEEAV